MAIGQSPSRYLGMEQALGEKPFVDDMSVPGMLHAAPVLSAHPRAKVLAIELRAALAMPGVVRVFTAADVPGQRGTGLAIPDLPIFVAVGETTCCVGDILALVVADTPFHARQAADKVEVEYEVLRAGDRSRSPRSSPARRRCMRRAICTCIRTCWTRRRFRAAMWMRRWPRPRTSSSRPSGRSRSNRRFSSRKLAWRMPQGNGMKVFSQSQGSTFDQNQIARIFESCRPKMSRSRWRPAAARSAPRKSCPSKRRPRWRRICWSAR